MAERDTELHYLPQKVQLATICTQEDFGKDAKAWKQD
jgi:hypothetical protein